MRNKYSEEARYSFKPEINLNSEVICATDPVRQSQNESEKFGRLYNADISKKATKQEQMQRDIYSDCTFQPKINSISDKIAPSLTSNDRYQNYEGQAKKEKLL